MGKFRDAMSRDMLLRGFSPGTQDAYLRYVAEFVKFHMRPPDKLGRSDILSFLMHAKTERRLSWCSFNARVTAIRFLYRKTLRKPAVVADLPMHKRPRRQLPVVLSRQEVAILIKAPANIKHRAIFATAYAAGLRASEVCRLLISDIDSDRMTLRVHEGKGKKDRYVPLSAKLLPVLRTYVRAVRPEKWLFPSQMGMGKKHLVPRALCHAMKRARRRAGIGKRIKFHSLRYAYATHLIEDGEPIQNVSQYLGHANIATTLIYLHMVQPSPTSKRSPFDHMPGFDF